MTNLAMLALAALQAGAAVAIPLKALMAKTFTLILAVAARLAIFLVNSLAASKHMGQQRVAMLKHASRSTLKKRYLVKKLNYRSTSTMNVRIVTVAPLSLGTI